MPTKEEEAARWRDISRNSRKAAQYLLETECWRSSVSRAYYAAYAAVTAELVSRGLVFAQERPNPGHSDLPAYILNNLSSLSRSSRFDLNKIIRRLYSARIQADYMAYSVDDRAFAVNALRELNQILAVLPWEEKEK